MIGSAERLRVIVLYAAAASGVTLWAAGARAEIALTDPAKTGGWEVTTNGRVNSYLSWVFGETINSVGQGNLIDPTMPDAADRYVLVGPQVSIQGYPTPSGAVASTINDKNLSTPRIRGGFASTILGFSIYKQISPNVRLTIKLGMWAGIQNGLVGGVRQQNDVAPVDWRDQFLRLDGPWGSVWGGRLLGLYNRGGMRMNWFLMHQHGVGHPCNVDSAGSAACGHTGVGSMFPNRNAQLGYATPQLAGLQASVSVLDASMIDSQWNRTPYPRIEVEATYQNKLTGTNEINAWANGLSQVIGRVAEVAPNPMTMDPGIAADATRMVWGAGGGAWARLSGFALGGTYWLGDGLGTATAFGNTAIDDRGTLRRHFGYLGVANLRLGNFEVAASYGSTNAMETPWDADPMNPRKISVIREVRGIGGKLAYHMSPVVFSIDGMNIRHEWHRGELQVANVISGGMLAEW